MENDERTTPWFDGNVKPVREGLYEVRSPCEGLNWSYFDGRQWNGCWSEPEWAQDYRRKGVIPTRWRGLASRPNARKASRRPTPSNAAAEQRQRA